MQAQRAPRQASNELGGSTNRCCDSGQMRQAPGDSAPFGILTVRRSWISVFPRMIAPVHDRQSTPAFWTISLPGAADSIWAGAANAGEPSPNEDQGFATAAPQNLA